MAWPSRYQLEQAVDVVLDGTFRSDAEMIHLGLGSKRALDMGHLPQSRPGGILEHLARLLDR